MPIAVAVVIVGVVSVYYPFQQEEGTGYVAPQPKAKAPVQPEQQVPVPKATGNIDDVINAISAFSDNELLQLSQEDSDIATAQEDKDNINNYLNVYDENEF